VSRLPDRLVYLVTDRRQLTPEARTTREEIAALEAWLDEAIGVVDVVQVRERDLDAAPLLHLVTRLARRAEDSPTRVVVNDRADVAVAAGADGVHLRADGVPVARVRVLGPAGWLVGRSAHTLSEVGGAGGADYVIFGTVFTSASKAAGTRAAGVDALRAAAGTSRAPVIAIGGIDPERASRCVEAGAGGVAAIGIFLPPGRTPISRGIQVAAEELRRAMTRQKA
jgi:thiamine-phosphate pyrophosphorylase